MASKSHNPKHSIAVDKPYVDPDELRTAGNVVGPAHLSDHMVQTSLLMAEAELLMRLLRYAEAERLFLLIRQAIPPKGHSQLNE